MPVTTGYASVGQNVDLGNVNDWTNPTNAQGAPDGSVASCAVADDSYTNGLRCKGFGLDQADATALGQFKVTPKIKSSAATLPSLLTMNIGDDSGNKIEGLFIGTLPLNGSLANKEIDIYAAMAAQSPAIPKSQLAGLRLDQLAVTFYSQVNDLAGDTQEVDSCYVDVSPLASGPSSGGGGTASGQRAAARVSIETGGVPVEIVVPIRLIIQIATGIDPESDGGRAG